jgi:hypothetical protein
MRVNTILGVGLISSDPKGSAKGEGNLLVITDGEVRRSGHGKRLDTSILLTVNDVD